MTRKIKSETDSKLKPGDIGGRGRHPNDPTGEIYGDNHMPLPQPHEKGETTMAKKDAALYVLIDVTNLAQTKILTVAPLHEVQCIGKIEKAAGREVIAPPLEGRGFAKLSVEQLQYLYWNTTQLPPPADYTELAKAMFEVAQKCPVDDRPLESLEKEVKRLYPDDSGSSNKQSSEPKAPKEPGAPAERPKGTSTTGRVWEIGDSILTGDPKAADWKDIRAKLMAACEAEGINKATAATQYSKWKGAKLAS